MNLRKFISGVSSLAIAASAFAGLAVTANAAVQYTPLYTMDLSEEATRTVSPTSQDSNARLFDVDDFGTGTDKVSAISALDGWGYRHGTYDATNYRQSIASIATDLLIGSGATKLFKIQCRSQSQSVGYITFTPANVDAVTMPSSGIVYYEFDIAGTGTSSHKSGVGFNTSTGATINGVGNTNLFDSGTASAKHVRMTYNIDTGAYSVLVDDIPTTTGTNSEIKGIYFYEGYQSYYEAVGNFTFGTVTAAPVPVTFTETNGVDVTVTMNDVDVTSGTSLLAGSYSYTATAEGYADYHGTVTVGDDDSVSGNSITMRVIEDYTVTATAKSGDTVLGTYTNSGPNLNQAGDAQSVFVYYPVLIEKDGKYYRKNADETRVGTDYYYWCTPLTEAAPTTTVYYTEVEDKDIVYYAEFEGATTGGITQGTNPHRYSGGGAVASGSMTTDLLPTGNYTVYVSARNGHATNTYTISVNDSNNTTLNTATLGGGATAVTENSISITLTEATTLTISSSNGNAQMDYAYVVYEGPYVTPPKAVATLVQDNITDDENYEGEDADQNAVYSVFTATITPGTNAVKSVRFTLNSADKETNEYTSEGFSGPAIFALIVPMASASVNDITAVIDGANYVAYTVE